VFHYNAQRVRAHVFLWMLAYYVEWHMRERLKPMLFDDERSSWQMPAARLRWPRRYARRMASKKTKPSSLTTACRCTASGHCCKLGTLAYNVTHTQLNPNAKITITTRPHANSGQGFQTARLESGLYPVAAHPASPKLKLSADFRLNVGQSSI
jgi:hypothetical protein